MKKESGGDKKIFLYGIGIAIAIIVVIVIAVMIQLNQKVPIDNVQDNKTNVDTKIDLSQSFRDSINLELSKQKDKNISLTIEQINIDSNYNIDFTLNCTTKLDFKREQDFIMLLANDLFKEYPDIYGKNSTTSPNMTIVSGAKCMYREGWKISKGYLGTMMVK